MRIRIAGSGWVCVAGFPRASGEAFLTPLLEHHDHANVECFCYADACGIPDSVTDSLRRQADVWKSIVGLSDAAAAELVRADKIDLLVDLAGHTARNRLLLLRNTPVQISYLGYPAQLISGYRLSPDRWQGRSAPARQSHCIRKSCGDCPRRRVRIARRISTRDAAG